MKKLSIAAAILLGCGAVSAQTYSLTVTKNDGKTVSIPTNEISKMEFVQNDDSNITADLLDVEFLADGTAVDRSPMHHDIITKPSGNLMTYYNDLHKRYVANFRNEMGSTVTSGYYRINYDRNGDFINRIADGCTFESIIKLNAPDKANAEVKWFSSMQAGGIGFILPIHTTSPNITFLPNVSTNGMSNWCWTHSTVQPVVGRYYHVVGVWDKAAGKTYIYVNGELSGSRNTPGNYVPVSQGAESFVIGGDPANNQTVCDASFNGEVVSVRIYDAPLNAEQVAGLWEKDKFDQGIPSDMNFTDLVYLPSCSIAEGGKYSIYGNGFAEGDVIEVSTVENSEPVALETTVSDGRITVVIPAGFKSGTYNFVVKRGDGQAPLVQVTINVSDKATEMKNPKVIAHRGAHTDGASENSLAALKKAMDANYYGIEFDTWMTADDVIVVHHDGVVNGRNFYQSQYDEIKNITLSNGEKLPTFDSFVATFKEKMGTSTSKLIIEIKNHWSDNRNFACVDQIMDKVEKLGLKDRVEYIAFDFNTCCYIASKDADVTVGYLSGNLEPAKVLEKGIKSIDYNSGVYANNPDWIKKALDLGVVVNVWTVNGKNEMLDFMGQNVDYITTDAPAVLTELNTMKFVE